jgi:membrane protease YdiL (CAAX protease family)
MRWPFIVFLLCEVAYLASVRVLIYGFPGPDLPLYWLALRIVSLVLLVWLFRLDSADLASNGLRNARGSIIGMAIFAVPLAVGNLGFPAADRYLIALGGMLAALREEFAYRGILQRTLVRKFGPISGLLIANIVFVAYHFGVQPFTIVNVLNLFFVGLVFGITFCSTGSILFAATLHSIYNVLWAFSPFTAQPLPMFAGPIIAGVAAFAVIVIGKWPKRRQSHESRQRGSRLIFDVGRKNK